MVQEELKICTNLLGALNLSATFMVDNDEVREVLKNALTEYSHKLQSSTNYVNFWNEAIKHDREWKETHETASDHR